MALALVIALLGLVLVNANLLALAVLHDLGLNGCAGDDGSTELGIFAIDESENFVKDDFLTSLNGKLFDEQRVAFVHAILLTASNDDCLHIVHLFP